MKKITYKFLLLFVGLATSYQASAQFGCDAAVVITNGFTATGITTPGNGGPEDWNVNPTGTSINASYWDDDVYMFKYTAGATSETISMTTFSRSSWNGIGIFSTCTGDTFSGQLAAQGTTGANTTKTVSATVAPGQTVYIATGQWGTPNNLDFDVTSFTATSIDSAPPCTTITNPTANATNVNPAGIFTWNSVATATSYVVNLGTTAGGTDVLNMVNVGNVLTYDTPGELAPSTTYYLTVIATNSIGGAVDCTEVTFTTLAALANDECSQAIVLTVNPDYSCTAITNGTLISATDSGVPDTGAGTPNDDVWYSFVATQATHRISLTNVTGTPTDLVHETFSGTCGNLASVLISDNNTSNPTGLTAGNTYYVRVFSYTATGTSNTFFDICVGTPPPAPANDDASNAIELTVNDNLACAITTTGTTISATASTDAAPTCNATGINDDVWYTFTATASAQTFTYSNVTLGTIATALYTGTVGNLTQVTGACLTGLSQSFTGLTAGTMYYARVYTTVATPATQTNFTICVGTPPPPPSNDECSAPIALVLGSTFDQNAIVGTNVSATTASTGLVYTCQTNRSADVWYSFVVPASGSVTIETKSVAGSAITDTVLGVFSGTCGALVQVDCDDDDGDGNFSIISLTGQTPGATLLVGVWRYSTGANGEFQVSAYDASLSANSFDIANFNYYPNPVNDILEFSYSTTITEVSIFNLLGQQLIARKVDGSAGQLDMTMLSAGTYIIKVSSATGSSTMKIVKR